MKPIWAVTPVKPVGSAKTRLASVLPRAVRSQLFKAMLSDVLKVLGACPELDRTLIVSSPRRAKRLAREHDALLLPDQQTGGLNGAITQAADYLCQQKIPTMLVLPADLPLIRPADIARLIARHPEQGPALTISPDRREDGTNALLLSPPNALPFHYGPGSFHLHQEAARNLGIPVFVARIANLAADLDLPDDLSLLSGGGDAIQKFLGNHGKDLPGTDRTASR